jgi:hypothetical protein
MPMSERVCRCTECRNVNEDIRTGAVDGIYGDICINCGHYSPIYNNQAEGGHCLKFAVREEKNGMGLVRRLRGKIRREEGDIPLVVGGGYSCCDFRPLHKRPEDGDPLLAFWDEAERRHAGNEA